MERKQRENYYLGLDIGTDSVGYAVTDENYIPIKKKGEPLLGVTAFEAAKTAAERRSQRTARRRIDRRQQRVQLVNEIFAPAIGEIDPKFFIRRAESRLYRDEAEEPFAVFNDVGFSDGEYYGKYPTIHHLLVELMRNTEPHDVRLVYIACAWLVAHRGHFLYDVAPEKAAELLKFETVYNSFCSYFTENEVPLPWPETVRADDVCEILLMQTGVAKKKDAFKNLYGGKKPAKARDEEFPFGREAICALLSGAKVKPEEVFQTGEFAEMESVSLTMADEDFAGIVGELGEAGELLIRLRAMQDCALLLTAKGGCITISEAKVEIYKQHKADLAGLKKLIKKYKPQMYNEIFRAAGKDNYTAYSYNIKGVKAGTFKDKKASKDDFLAYIKKCTKDIVPDDEDKAFTDDMRTRIDLGTFMPKQKNSDNRVIPQQLYRVELQKILDNAESYIPWLTEKDESGLSAKEKLLSIFDFKIPYFVGPLTGSREDHTWIVRKGEGKIYPWNFEEKVDLDASEERFIRRMTNTCTYAAGAPVLPAKSLLYCRFMVLNEINNLRVDGNAIPVSVKQEIYNEVMLKCSRVTLKKIKDYLVSTGKIGKNSVVSGADTKLNATLFSQQKFKRLLESGVLTEREVEAIIRRAAYSEDKGRFLRWLERKYAKLSKEDRRYIAGLNLKEFGRLSEEFLTQVVGAEKATGEAFTVMEALWNTNNNLMQLLSDRFTFAEELEKRNSTYYAEHPVKLSERLDEMYISNAVKRPILRTLDICDDIAKAMGYGPRKIFIEMARDASGEKRGTRSVTREHQLRELYRKIRNEDVRHLEKELDAMGEMADNKLQSDRLFLYYLQLGRCAYSGEPIDISRLADGTYNVDHIYPQAFVKDDSILNNKVLVSSKINGDKKDIYPIDESIRKKMRATWDMWKAAGLITEEKYRRLTRSTPFTDDEKWGFINRQLVETRQSTKAVAQILKERYPESDIVYVKAGLVSEFRQEFELFKSRQVNNLHHAKDAYLNIVVGNVYDCKFSRRWFSTAENYSMRTRTLFTRLVTCGAATVWQGESDIAKVRKIAAKNHIRVTRYAFMRKGGLFDQMPVKAAPGLVPLKAGLPTERYGGYNKPTASFYYLAKYSTGKKGDIMFVPVELIAADRCMKDKDFAEAYVNEAITKIIGKPVTESKILLDHRPIKIGTVIETDGLRLIVNGKSSGGRQVIVSLASPLIVSVEHERYIKRLERFQIKTAENSKIKPDQQHDRITEEENIKLYDLLTEKMNTRPFCLMPGNQGKVLKKGRTAFAELNIGEQVKCLLNIVSLFGAAQKADLSAIGGSSNAGTKLLSANLSNWANQFHAAYIIDQSASGIYERRSVNLLELL